ncbi:MAG: PQQ-like beta-propeller repeat protein [Planctomycetota bacterium]|nr:PQQ-like beta-propeller repeat protein [Planctomycetota bacterium]
MFLGGRVTKKLDRKFLLHCLDAMSGKVIWKAQEKRADAWFEEIRLRDQGDEPGFVQVFLHDDLVVTHGLFDVLAFDLKDGRLRWRYEVPFDFEIEHALLSGDLLVLSGRSDTIALYIPTGDPRGEVAWESREEGGGYVPPYFDGDRLVLVREMPFNVTVRHRATGGLIGRLELPDLTGDDRHPLLEKAPPELPFARDGGRMAVTDGRYVIMVDTREMRLLWKCAIGEPNVPMRLALGGDYLAVVKNEYDRKAIYMLSAASGKTLWGTDPKNPSSPQPIYSMQIRDGRLYGIGLHPGQGFYIVGLDCATGKPLFKPQERVGYSGKPAVRLRGPDRSPPNALVAEVADRQDFDLLVFDSAGGRLLHSMRVKSAGEFGEYGQVSATVQHGLPALLGREEMLLAAPAEPGAGDRKGDRGDAPDRKEDGK